MHRIRVSGRHHDKRVAGHRDGAADVVGNVQRILEVGVGTGAQLVAEVASSLSSNNLHIISAAIIRVQEFRGAVVAARRYVRRKRRKVKFDARCRLYDIPGVEVDALADDGIRRDVVVVAGREVGIVLDDRNVAAVLDLCDVNTRDERLYVGTAYPEAGNAALEAGRVGLHERTRFVHLRAVHLHLGGAVEIGWYNGRVFAEPAEHGQRILGGLIANQAAKANCIYQDCV